MQGRNYIKEFPDSIDFLIKRIYQLVDDANPHLENGLSILNIASDPDHEFVSWRFYFEDTDVYITDDNAKTIHLFYPSDINNEKLRSLILEDAEVADEWLSKLFVEIRNREQQ